VDILPSYSTIRRALLFLDYEEYSARLAQFLEIEPIPGETLALDGKVLRGSYLLETDNPHSQPHKAITFVTAYLVERGLILQACEVKDKSNEITAIPDLLDWLDLKGTLVSIDAMGCQTAIADKILSKKGDYFFALKGNQGTLNDSVRLFFETPPKTGKLELFEDFS